MTLFPRPVVLAVDPGRDAAWSVFQGQALVAVGFRELPLPECLPLRSRVVVERPSIHGGTRNPASIVTLAIDLGMRVAPYKVAGFDVEYVLPTTWKGNVKKDVCASRVKARLTEEELEVVADLFKSKTDGKRSRLVVSKGKQHNVWDGIGIGLWAVGRFGRGVS